MIQFVPYKAEHLHQLVLQDAQRYMDTYLDDHRYAKAIEVGECWTCLCDEKIIGCGGLIRMWEGRAAAWTLLSNEAGKHFSAIHRFVKKILQRADYRRVEATVDCLFPDGHRWMRLLGFEIEAIQMRGYRPDGGDCTLYARVK